MAMYKLLLIILWYSNLDIIPIPVKCKCQAFKEISMDVAYCWHISNYVIF